MVRVREDSSGIEFSEGCFYFCGSGRRGFFFERGRERLV